MKEHIKFLKEAKQNKEELIKFWTAGESYKEINEQLMDKIGDEHSS